MDIFPAGQKVLLGYSDGSLRAFDLITQKVIGQFTLSNPEQESLLQSITKLKFLKSGRNVLVANSLGEIFVIYIESWEEFRVHAKKIADTGHSVFSLDIDFFDPFHVFLTGTSHGLINVFQRKNFQPDNPIIVEQQLKNVSEIEYYTIDEFKFNRKNEQIWK